MRRLAASFDAELAPPAAEINEGNTTVKAAINGENGTNGRTDPENKKEKGDGAGAAAKAGAKRNSGAVNDGLPKVRGKPDPKRRKGWVGLPSTGRKPSKSVFDEAIRQVACLCLVCELTIAVLY